MFRFQKTRLAFVMLSIVALVIGYNMYNKKHVDFTRVGVVAEYKASEFNEFVKSLSLEERGEIGNNVYSVEGVVSILTEEGFIIQGGVFCKTESPAQLASQQGDSVKVRGRFVGYDDIFLEVRLDHVVPF